MRKAASLLALPLLLAVPLLAQMPTEAPGAKDAARVTGGTYQADPHHSLVGWRLNHLGFNDYFGIFGDVTGTLTLDPKNPAAAKVDVTIPIASVTVASAGLKDHLLRAGKDGSKPDFFGADPAPARFVSTAVVVDEEGDEAKVTGNLTLNGVTKPVTLDVDFTGAGPAPMSNVETVGFEAEATIKRSDFGLGFGVPLVGDEVELEITAAFEKK
ncbi:YceI family protein [Sphingopyxis indica]|uniref:Polyisoprenoid-binding protein YceI n=1 Tax=Sphingopyxis indica TaxID=436663 RepID=A0A239DKX7_9SPHN|nr:YceI family protein [Sphingopyxis indica]SNS33077.1 Polyisoprenoid-binding protein YceI [Sphingopyxis indica]